MSGFDHHGWLQLPNCEGQMRDATPAEAAGEYADHKELARQMQMSPRDRAVDVAFAVVKFLVAVIFFASLVIFVASMIDMAHGADNGQWKDLPPDVRQWFNRPKISECCALSDGTRTDWEIKPDGYYVPVPWHPQGHEYWVRVPDNAVITSEGNPVGQALIWYGPNSIRCFVPGGGV